MKVVAYVGTSIYIIRCSSSFEPGVWQVEADPWCRSVIESRIIDGFAERAKIHHDIVGWMPDSQSILARGITGGWPCQA